VIAKDHRSWSFTDRSFLFAFSVSVLWHLFWFFSVTIVVTPAKIKSATQTKTVFLGPVLNDAIFRTLVESRPEVSKAFYRKLAEYEPATEVPTQTIERHASGDVTSLPEGKNFAQSLKALIGGSKSAPEGWADLPAPVLGGSGPLKGKEIFKSPDTEE